MVFEVAEFESGTRFRKFKMANPRIIISGFFGVVESESGVKFWKFKMAAIFWKCHRIILKCVFWGFWGRWYRIIYFLTQKRFLKRFFFFFFWVRWTPFGLLRYWTISNYLGIIISIRWRWPSICHFLFFFSFPNNFNIGVFPKYIDMSRVY